MRRVEDDAHEHASNRARDGDRHEPGKDQEPHTLEVDRFDSAVAKTDSDRRARDAHGRADGEGILREEQDGDGGAHFHGGA